MYTGDKETVSHLVPGMDAVLSWFRRHADDSGLPSRLPYWNNVDWCPDWDRGQPPGWDIGPTCIISSQYIYYASKFRYLLGEVSAETSLAASDEGIQKLRKALDDAFWSEKEGLYLDYPGGNTSLSQYSNAWAILAGVPSEEKIRQILKRFPGDPKLSRASFFGLYYVVQALLSTGAYERVFPALGVWEEMADFGLSTWAEETTYWRSLCHAWSAHPALLFLEDVLGIKPLSPGYGSVVIEPKPFHLTAAAGGIPLKNGRIDVEWNVSEGRMTVNASVPPGTAGELILPDGSRKKLSDKSIKAHCFLD
jgi:hypothetical protein